MSTADLRVTWFSRQGSLVDYSVVRGVCRGSVERERAGQRKDLAELRSGSPEEPCNNGDSLGGHRC